MIVREVLFKPELADNFDHFNNYDNTLAFLEACVVRPEWRCGFTVKYIKSVIARLKSTHKIWIQEIQMRNKKQYGP